MQVPEIDTEAEQLRELGRATDLQEGRPLGTGDQSAELPETRAPGEGETAEPTSPSTGKEPEQPVSSEPTPPDTQRPDIPGRDERGRFKGAEKEAAEEAPTQIPDQQRPQTDYDRAKAKAAKENQRYDRSWSTLQAEKEAFRAQVAEWEEQMRVGQLQQQAAVPIEQLKDKNGLSLAEYAEWVPKFEADGDFENAHKALKGYLALQSGLSDMMAQRQEAEIELGWRKQMEDAIRANPDVANPQSPLFREADRIINENRFLFYVPNGFHRAVEIAQLIVERGADSELREENERLRAENERFNRSAQPVTGGPARPSGPTAPEDMSLAEEEAYLRDLTRQADSGR